MLRRLFLSIIILSTLASEGGAFYSAELIDYYLVNLAHLGIIQDSRDEISSFEVQKLNSLEKKGIPVAFYKLVSEESIVSKASNKNNHLEFLLMYGEILVVAITIMLFICSNNQISFITRRALLSLADSSPPTYC